MVQRQHFHNGRLLTCVAQPGQCPVSDMHFTDAEQANQFFDNVCMAQHKLSNLPFTYAKHIIKSINYTIDKNKAQSKMEEPFDEDSFVAKARELGIKEPKEFLGMVIQGNKTPTYQDMKAVREGIKLNLPQNPNEVKGAKLYKKDIVQTIDDALAKGKDVYKQKDLVKAAPIAINSSSLTADDMRKAYESFWETKEFNNVVALSNIEGVTERFYSHYVEDDDLDDDLSEVYERMSNYPYADNPVNWADQDRDRYEIMLNREIENQMEKSKEFSDTMARSAYEDHAFGDGAMKRIKEQAVSNMFPKETYTKEELVYMRELVTGGK